VSTKNGNGYMAFNTVTFMKHGPVTVFGRMAIFNPQPTDDDDVSASIFGSGRDGIGFYDRPAF
jgi:hypothetical protein